MKQSKKFFSQTWSSADRSFTSQTNVLSSFLIATVPVEILRLLNCCKKTMLLRLQCHLTHRIFSSHLIRQSSKFSKVNSRRGGKKSMGPQRMSNGNKSFVNAVILCILHVLRKILRVPLPPAGFHQLIQANLWPPQLWWMLKRPN